MHAKDTLLAAHYLENRGGTYEKLFMEVCFLDAIGSVMNINHDLRLVGGCLTLPKVMKSSKMRCSSKIVYVI